MNAQCLRRWFHHFSPKKTQILTISINQIDHINLKVHYGMHALLLIYRLPPTIYFNNNHFSVFLLSISSLVNMFSRLEIPLLQSNKYLLNASEVLGLILHARKIVANKLKPIWPYVAYSLIGQKTNGQVITRVKNC